MADLLLSVADTNLPRVTPAISRSKSEDVSRFQLHSHSLFPIYVSVLSYHHPDSPTRSFRRGFVKKGYEPLRDLFDQLARDGQFNKAQVNCIK